MFRTSFEEVSGKRNRFLYTTDGKEFDEFDDFIVVYILPKLDQILFHNHNQIVLQNIDDEVSAYKFQNIDFNVNLNRQNVDAIKELENDINYDTEQMSLTRVFAFEKNGLVKTV